MTLGGDLAVIETSEKQQEARYYLDGKWNSTKCHGEFLAQVQNSTPSKSLYKQGHSLSPANQQVEISVWNQNIMNRAHNK